MALPERRECVPTYYRDDTSLSATTHRHSAMMKAMMLDAMMEKRP